MDQLRQTLCSAQARCVSDAGSAQSLQRSGFLFGILPQVLQVYLPRVPYIGKTASRYGIKLCRQSVHTQGNSLVLAKECGNSLVLAESRQTESSATSESDGYTVEDYSSDDGPDTFSRPRRQAIVRALSESCSGVQWSSVDQGFNLLRVAIDESAEKKNPVFIRQLYIHAMTYLLQALPSELSSEEHLGISSALPASLIDPRLDGGNVSQRKPQQSPSQSPSTLHRTLAFAIVQLFVFFQFILPYVKYLLAAAVQYEREKQVLRRSCEGAFQFLATMGSYHPVGTAFVHNVRKGIVGKILTAWSAWIVEGVVGGVCDGVGEGIGMLSGEEQRRENR